MNEENDLEYPDETFGSILAREARVKGNRLTRQEREELFRIGMPLASGADEAIEAKSTWLE